MLVGLTSPVVAATPPDPAAAAAMRPGWVTELESRQPLPGAVPWRGSSAAPLGASKPTPTPEVAFPAANRWEVRLGAAGVAAAPTGARAAAKPTVRVAAKAGDTAGRPLRIDVLDRATAQRAGISGYAFTVTDLGESRAKLPATLSVDYAGFAAAYGSSYPDRLRLLALPGCAIAQPRATDCRLTGRALPARFDRATSTLVADVADVVAGGESAVYALASAPGGDEGTFAATPLSVSGRWQVAPGSGEFSYSYPISVPAPAGGSPPSVGLGYSSGAIDGLTVASNTQASPTGLGWSDFANAFIERRYEPCYVEVKTSDLCWKGDNATISLAGISGPLIPKNDAGTEWVVQSDPGWRIQRLTGAPYTTIHQGQHWKVTGPDGTVYFFGYGHMPGQQTNSILAVPVLADHAGEPCRGRNDTVGGCDQGWRWYLDRVVDPDGNVSSFVYDRETNHYNTVGGIGGNKPYHRGALLKEIYYGGRDWDSANYAGRVVFELQWRCGFLVQNCPEPVPNAGTAAFPDVPSDLMCTADAACTVYAPSFFLTKRYAAVRSEVRIGTVWEKVAQHNLYHSFGTGADGVARKLQLESIQQAGIAFGKLNAYPHTRFTYKWKDNRADHDANIPKAMRHNRIDTITNPFGARTTVTYGSNRFCDQNYDPHPRWDENVRDCFPQRVVDGDFSRTGVFHKYLVSSVTELPGDGTLLTTAYNYEGDPAWAFDSSAFARDEDEFGWSAWRGYGTATITRGDAKTRLRIFRGWDQDPILKKDGDDWVPLEKRDVTVTTFDGQTSFRDHRALAGKTLEEEQYGTRADGSGKVLQSRRYGYERRTTHQAEDYLYAAEWVGQTSTMETVHASATASRQRRSTTTYNAHFQPTSVHEEGWLDTGGDERCTITTYADNPALGMFNYPAVNKRVAGGCDSATVLTLAETYYDGSTTLGAAPQRGNPTRQRTQVEAGRWSVVATEYDALGRATRVTDPTGAVSTTAYAVAAGGKSAHAAVRTTITNALGHTATTEWHPQFGVPKREVDVNGRITDYSYDEFGRLTAVWLPTEPLAFAEPSIKFAYDVPRRTVRTQRLVSEERCCEGARFEDSWVVYDGLWRERQTQLLSPVNGYTIVSGQTYDDQGRVRDEIAEQAVATTPGSYIGSTTWQNLTRHQYDELGRTLRTERFHGSTPYATTRTAYGLDTVTVTGPDGRQAREQVDGLGRRIAAAEHDGQGWAASTYTYDLADRLLTVKDPAGNQIGYSYNLAGWRTGQSDPNRGGALFGYDDAGRQTVVADGRGTIVTSYDGLGRTTQRRAGSATGPLLASWSYDTAAGGKGQPHRVTTHTAEGDWVSEVAGYDDKGRPTGTRITVPAGIPGLSGTYAYGQSYDRADRVVRQTLPAIGGLPAEELVTDYNSLGLPTRLAGLTEYVWNVGYDDRGRKTSVGIGPRPGGGTWLARRWTYDDDQRASGTETYLAGSAAPNGIVAAHTMSFDRTGNVTENLTRLHDKSWRECYGYDARSRLVTAHTVDSTTSCAAGQAGTGAQPYAHTYRYSVDGRMLERVEDGVTTGYTYPATGAARPHAPTKVGADSYSWNGVGALTSRTVGGRTETLGWDVQGRLASVSGPGGRTAYVYDAEGQRLLRRTPDGRATLYLPGHEVTANAAGTSVTAVRTYTFEGQLVATRGPGGVQYPASAPGGSVELAATSGTTPTATRAYTPYGRVRASSGGLDTERGFLGQFADASTGLSYLNARYYDATIGVFVSADPLYDTARPKTQNPYAYGVNNPTTYADPSGTYSAQMWGLERQNAQLRAQNKELVAHIGRLGNHIEDLQGIIRKQQKQINQLLSYVAALEAEISRQASIIQQLQERVAYLERVVAAQRQEISRLRRVVAQQAGIIRFQARVIRWQAGVITYQRGVIGQLVDHAFLPGARQGVLDSIDNFRGIPSWEGSRVEFLEWKGRWLWISSAIGLKSHEVGNIIDDQLAQGVSRDSIDRGLDFLSMMAITTQGEQARMEAQAEVLGILSDHYAQMEEDANDALGFIIDTGCFAAGWFPGLGEVSNVACYGEDAYSYFNG
ncbi:RHS repeat-associated core domain-containing protein [Asanoa sp. WMMD1127]|uniref:RHS repeat-associated core domain-containing protein n=1 Tax=Asanoa sp. WMMD1127 TaxID=3016107 RepID=UPI002417108B|nr:RHS repeat-associated core domain-containing protein [Asanoa sp. WMMD1127]MDG4822943.1 RHS repeat-associated core domain-containing protein [Asanoa sp. WMMD1127]